MASLVLMLCGFQIFLPRASAGTSTVVKNGGGPLWSDQVDKIDSGDESPDPFLEAEIQKNFLRELTKTKKFKHVLRSDDSNANNVSDLFILKTTMEENVSSGETHRATLDDVGLFGAVPRLLLRARGPTTASGVIKLRVHIRLYTREGHVVLEDVVLQNVQSIADTLRATRMLARNMAITLKRSSLPEPVPTPPGQETAKTSKCQVGTITSEQCHQAPRADPFSPAATLFRTSQAAASQN
ncbi:MAG: hypothetical protein WBV55_13470 [Candidatus Sulfotelmatobacter sp.]